MRDIKDMSPETRARHLKHLEETKKANKNKKSDDRNVLDLVTHMGDKPLKKSGRTIVTSENREEFMKKKLGLADKEKEIRDELEKKDYSKMASKDRPHGIWHKETEKLHSHHENEDAAYEAYKNIGYHNVDHTMGELTPKERKQYGYE